MSALSKTPGGLSVDVDESGVISKDVLGLDIQTDDLTIAIELGRLVYKLRRDLDGDIMVTPMGIILCNITARGKLQKSEQ